MKNLVKKACAEIGVEISDRQAQQFEIYYNLLREWNEKINLTRIIEPGEVAVKHFADSLSLLNYAELPQGARVIDVGTGAGFPGLPLKIVRPDIRLTLLDSLNKRLKFLDEICGAMNIDAELIHSRAEDGGRSPKLREKFDLVVSRAVAQMNVLAEYCLPYVKVGGSFVAMKGPDIKNELEAATESIETLGGEIEALDEFILPSAGERTIVTIAKTEQTPKGYPRQSGKIKRKKNQ